MCCCRTSLFSGVYFENDPDQRARANIVWSVRRQEGLLDNSVVSILLNVRSIPSIEYFTS